MALDESNDTDNVYEVDGFTYLVNKALMERATSIKIDFSPMGFKLDSNIDFGPSACGSCSTTGSCCS